MANRWVLVLGTVLVLTAAGWAGWWSVQPDPAARPAPSAAPVPQDELTRRVVGVLCKQLECDAARLTPTTDLLRDMKADELDIVEITAALEAEFEIRLPAAEAAQLKTVADWIGIVRTRTR